MKYEPQITYQRIQDRCKEINLKIKDLNAKCGISKDTLSKAAKSEEGMKAANLFSIAECLDCSVDYLLGKSEMIETSRYSLLSSADERLLGFFRKLSPIEQGEIIGEAKLLVKQHESAYQKEEA